LYDCDYCRKQKLYEKRACFLQTPKMSIPFPVFDEDRQPIEGMVDWRECDADTFFEGFCEICDLFPSRSMWDIYMEFFKLICPTSFIDPIYNEVVEMEAACTEYHVLPYGVRMEKKITERKIEISLPRFLVKAWNWLVARLRLLKLATFGKITLFRIKSEELVPVGGGYLDQPPILRDIFNTIRGARAMYTTDWYEKIAMEAKRKSASTQGGGA